VPLEWVHTESYIGTRHVGEDGGQKRLFEETGDHDLVSHTLLEDGESTSLTNEKIGPLDNDDTGEEGGVAREFDNLSLAIGPFLSVAVFERVVTPVVPFLSDLVESAGQESVLHQDDEVDDKSGESLQHTNLTVGHGDKTLVDKTVALGVSRRSLHDVALGLFVGKRDGRQEIGSQIDTENGDGTERKWDAAYDESQEW